tara:strand:- start:195 stop:350 length:156 start_codon:yes stop_codon:yes gene_type:complete
MLYQVGLILILVVIALIFSKKLSNSGSNNNTYVYEDEMSKDELDNLDDEID